MIMILTSFLSVLMGLLCKYNHTGPTSVDVGPVFLSVQILVSISSIAIRTKMSRSGQPSAVCTERKSVKLYMTYKSSHISVAYRILFKRKYLTIPVKLCVEIMPVLSAVSNYLMQVILTTYNYCISIILCSLTSPPLALAYFCFVSGNTQNTEKGPRFSLLVR